MSDLKISNITFDYHRNGISGAPFKVFLFDKEESGDEKRRMLGVVFEEEGHCAVFDVELLSKGEIRFFYNSWRGDNFEGALRKFAEAKDSEK